MISIGLKSLEIFENPNIPSISIDEPIEIIIPVYNAYQLLKNCLESIWKNTTLQYRLIVVDDNSNDNNVRKLLNEFQKRYSPNNFILIHNETNIGFVKSVNKAAKIVKNHFVVLNTDTEVPPNWLERLIYPILKFDKIASVTPFTNAGTICSFPEFLKDNELFLGLTTEQIDHYFQYIDIDKNLIEIPTGVGFCMAFNKEVYDKIGLFDEVFGKGYGEENDWCMRAKKIGYKNVIATNLFVYHKHGSSFSSEEKRILLERNMKILLQKHPDYSFLVDEFIKKDPLKEIRLFVQSKILSTKNDPILIIDHMLGGGANEFSKTLINKSPFTLYLTFNFKENIYQISLITNQEEIFQTKLKTFYDLESFIKMFEIQKIYINELVSYPFVMEIIDFLVELYYKYQEKIKYYLYIHDFFVICPNFNLITYYNNIYKYCGIPNDFGFCNQCLKKNLIFFYLNPFIIYCNKNLSIEEWRSKFSRFLNIAFKIIVFSNNSKGILLKAYPNLDEGKIEVVPHSVSWVRQAIVKKTNSTINIGIIGNITVHKGNLVIISLCDFIKKFELDIKVHVFGDFDKMKFDIRKYDNLILHGQYNKSFLPELMEKFEIDIIFIPSIWPETFSYTTEEAIKMGLPVAVFNIGAPAERVKNYEKGLILDKNDPEYIISSILKFLNSINEEKYKNISFENIPTSKERNISIVFFSKDRPMQLDAALRTFLINCKINQKAHKYVLYKVSENKYEKEYDLLKSNFPSVIFVREKDFKNDLLNLIKGTDYIFFSVDDSIYTNNFSLEKILRLLDQDSSVLGFSLRLGKNTNYCYPLDKFQNLPNFEPIENKILKFNWTISEYDFGYPLEVSSSIYRTKDLLPILENSFFTNPNTLESLLDNQKNIFASSKPYLLCFETSVAFSNPLNLVQTAWKNRASEKEKYSKENLLDLFSKGFRINTDKFQGFVSNSPHQEVDIEFININKKDNPLVSVIIPCYNQAEFLPEAVESVVNQTFQDWECIIVNDGSSDNTREVSTKLIAKYSDKRIIYLEEENKGPSQARNNAIKHAKGQYILPLDADDKIHPEFLEKTVKILNNFPEYAIVYTDLQEFGVRNNIVYAKDWFKAEPIYIANHLSYCSLFRKEVWVDVGGYNPQMEIGYEDWDFWISAFEKGYKGFRIAEPLFFYRIRDDTRQTRAEKFDKLIKAQIILNHPNLYTQLQRQWAEAVLNNEPWALKINDQIGVILTDEQLKFQISKVNFIKEIRPLVSVIIPTYNRPSMLIKAINSVLTQTLGDFEAIVVNDAGLEVKELIERFNDRRIRYFRNPKNIGLAGTRNVGLKQSKGKYIAYLDDDDLFFPNHLSTLVSVLEANNDLWVVYSDAIRFHQAKIGEDYYIFNIDFPYSQDFDRIKLLFGNYTPVNCVVHRRELIDKIGYFDESLSSHEDWDLWVRASRYYDFLHIKTFTCAITLRTDNTSMTTSWHDSLQMTKTKILLRNKSFLIQEVENFITNGELDTAETIVNEMLKLYDFRFHPEALVDLGVIKSLKGNINEAIEIFKKVLEFHPNNEVALENLLILTGAEKSLGRF